MSALLSPRILPLAISNSAEITSKRLKSRCHSAISLQESSLNRRLFMGGLSISVLTFFNLKPTRAEEGPDNASDDDGVFGALKSFFDPDEKTKKGKILPKDYLKSAKEVVKTLRESVNEDTSDMAKFRRTADSAKESIREYLNGWSGQKKVVDEESYAMLEKAMRSLAGFYSEAGPTARLPEELKAEILSDLATAEEFL